MRIEGLADIADILRCYGIRQAVSAIDAVIHQVGHQFAEMADKSLEVFPHLDLLGAGARVKNPGDLFSRQSLGETIGRAAEQYDFVVIDSPPVLPVNDAAALSKWADVTVFVARQDAVSQAEIEQALTLFAKAGNPVSGQVFNGYMPSTLRYGYGYGYGYGYRKYGGRYGKGYGYGYGYGKGYGHGYGDGEDTSHKTKR